MHTKWGLVVAKKEMTRLWIDGKMVPVTMVEILPQKIVRYKTVEKDGYQAAVIGVNEVETKKEKGQKLAYDMQIEFDVDDAYVSAHEAGSLLDLSSMDGVQTVEVKWTSKWKWYQGAMKRFHLQGGPETHGSKFHRHIWSMGNRKPRRTMKNHPHAWHMWDELITLKHVQIIDSMKRDNEQLLLVKWSLPGAKNGKLKFIIE